MLATEKVVKQNAFDTLKVLIAQGELTLEEIHRELGFPPPRIAPGSVSPDKKSLSHRLIRL